MAELAGDQQVNAATAVDIGDGEEAVFVEADVDVGRDGGQHGAADGHVAPEQVVAEVPSRRVGRGEFAARERQGAQGERVAVRGAVDEPSTGRDDNRATASQGATAAVANLQCTAVDGRTAGVSVVRGEHQRAAADLRQAEATAELIEPGYGERVGIHAHDGIGAQGEAVAIIAPNRQGIITGEAADGAEATDAGAPDMHVLIKANATAEGERGSFEDVGHGGSAPPADAEGGVVSD